MNFTAEELSLIQLMCDDELMLLDFLGNRVRGISVKHPRAAITGIAAKAEAMALEIEKSQAAAEKTSPPAGKLKSV